MKQTKRSAILSYVLLGLGGIVILAPLYFVIITAFKTNPEIISNFFALPTQFTLDNFKEIVQKQNFFTYLGNSFFITVVSLALNVLILPMTAYPIARRMGSSKKYRFLYFFLIVGIFVPFQVRMLPLVKWLSTLHLLNQTGLIFCYLAGSICDGVFLYVGYIVSLPTDLEEAAYIDGASSLRTYTNVIFPLLKPMTATMLIKDGIWIWNDFTLPLLVLNKSPSSWTLVLFQYNFKSAHAVNYSMVFTCLLIAMIPITILYLFMQKSIIGGLTNGAVKG